MEGNGDPPVRRSRLWIVGIVLGLTAIARGAVDEPALLRDLQSPDYAVRDDASRRMLTDDSFDRALFLRLYASASTPEQRHRILDAARHHFLLAVQEDATKVGGAASMGLTLLPVVARGEVAGVSQPAARVGLTFPGFPAYALLKPGDLILTLDGREVPDTEAGGIGAFIEIIKAHPLNRPLNIGVLREGRRLDVTMRLASRVALQSIYQPDGASLRPELEVRWEEQARAFDRLDPAAEPLRADLPALTPADQPIGPELDEADARLRQLRFQIQQRNALDRLAPINIGQPGDARIEVHVGDAPEQGPEPVPAPGSR